MHKSLITVSVPSHPPLRPSSFPSLRSGRSTCGCSAYPRTLPSLSRDGHNRPDGSAPPHLDTQAGPFAFQGVAHHGRSCQRTAQSRRDDRQGLVNLPGALRQLRVVTAVALTIPSAVIARINRSVINHFTPVYKKINALFVLPRRAGRSRPKRGSGQSRSSVKSASVLPLPTPFRGALQRTPPQRALPLKKISIPWVQIRLRRSKSARQTQ